MLCIRALLLIAIRQVIAIVQLSVNHTTPCLSESVNHSRSILYEYLRTPTRSPLSKCTSEGWQGAPG